MSAPYSFRNEANMAAAIEKSQPVLDTIISQDQILDESLYKMNLMR